MSCLLYTGYCLILFERSIFGYSEILESTQVYAVCTTVDFLEYQKSRVERGYFQKKNTQIIRLQIIRGHLGSIYPVDLISDVSSQWQLILSN